MKENINFNRAAAFYDATRKLRDDIADQITHALLAEIRSAEANRVLEVGIGTGRMARPLMREGVQMVGVDISPEMMGQLVAQLTPEHTPPELLLGDATALPFREWSFRAAMVVHVLHLVKSPDDAIREISRVLTPGGVLLQQTRRPDEETREMWDATYEAWGRLFKKRGYERRPRQGEMSIIRERIRASGASLRIVDVVYDEYVHTVKQDLDDVRERIHSWTWEVPDDILNESLPEFAEWMYERFGPPETELVDRQTYEVEVWRWA